VRSRIPHRPVALPFVVLLLGGKAPARISFGVWKVTPVGGAIGVGSGLRKTRLALLISHHSSMALSSCVRLWQSFMNMPPQSRNCMKSVTVEMRAVRNR